MLFRFLLVFSLLFSSNPVFSENLDGYDLFKMLGAENLGQNNIGQGFHFINNGQHYIIKLTKIVPYGGSEDGNIRLFEVVDHIGQAPADSVSKDLQMKPYSPEGVNAGEGGVVDGVGGDGSGSSGGYGLGDGIADGVGIGAIVYGAGTMYTAGYSLSTGIASQLRNNFKNNLNQNRIYAENLGKAAASIKEASSMIDSATSSMVGDMLSKVNNEIPEDHKAKQMLEDRLKPAECDVKGAGNSFFGMPSDFQVAYLSGDLSRVSEYIELLNDPKNLSSFCLQQLRGLTNGSGVISLSKVEPNLPTSPIDTFEFKTKNTSSEGSLVRHLANKYQVQWSDTFGMQASTTQEKIAYSTGLAMLKSADRRLADGQFGKGASHAKASELLLNVSSGFTEGFAEAAQELAETAPILASALKNFVVDGINDPSTMVEKSQTLLNAVPEIADAIKQDLIKDFEIIKNGSSFERSKLLGKVALDVSVSFITGGTTKIIKSTGSTAAKVVRKTTDAKLVKKIRNTFSRSEYDDFVLGRALEKSGNIDMKLIKRAGSRLEEGVKELAQKGIKLSDNAKDYLANQILHEDKILKRTLSKDEIITLGRRYTKFEKIIPNLPKSSYSGNIYRAINKEVNLPNGVVIKNTPEEVFKLHYHSYTFNHRFSTVGDVGLYATTGKSIKEVIPTILDETSQKLDDLIVGKLNVDLDGLLDLSASSVGLKNLEKMGITLERIIQERYDYTQAIGHVSRKKGIKGIKFQSQYSNQVNIVIF